MVRHTQETNSREGENLAALQSAAAENEQANLKGLLEVTLGHQKAETVAHLEHQLAAALLLQSRHEVYVWPDDPSSSLTASLRPSIGIGCTRTCGISHQRGSLGDSRSYAPLSLARHHGTRSLMLCNPWFLPLFPDMNFSSWQDRAFLANLLQPDGLAFVGTCGSGSYPSYFHNLLKAINGNALGVQQARTSTRGVASCCTKPRLPTFVCPVPGVSA